MGNCGVTFAPCKPGDREYLARLMESVEDVPAKSIASGMPWNWETYGEYIDALETVPKGVNVRGLVGHCAVRLFAMGEEALANKPATADQIRAMHDAVAEALDGGALGFSTSRTPLHLTPDGDAVPGTHATAEELRGICAALGTRNQGVVEAATAAQAGEDDEAIRQSLANEMAWMTDISAETGRPVVFNLAQTRQQPRAFQWVLDAVEKNQGNGVRLVPQSTTRGIGVLFGFQNRTPFDRNSSWRALRGIPMGEKVAKLRDPDYRATMVEECLSNMPPLDCSELFLMRRDAPRYDHQPNESLTAHAERLGKSLPDTFIELSLAENGMALFNFPFLNPDMNAVETMLTHPSVVLGLGDSGAHCGMIMDASLPTSFLTYWIRERGLFDIQSAIHKLTLEPANLFGIRNRGILKAGAQADVNVIDYEGMRLHGPEFVKDFPAGAGRYIQRASGCTHTFVNGQLFMQHGEHASAFAGSMLRGNIR